MMRREGKMPVARWQVPVKVQNLYCHDKTSKRYHVPIDGSEVSCHAETGSVKSKKPACRQAGKAPVRRPAVPIVCLGSRISPGATKFDK